MNIDETCRNCGKGTLSAIAGCFGGESRLQCHICGWFADALHGERMPPKSEAWANASERGISWVQFDREWEAYQRSRMVKP